MNQSKLSTRSFFESSLLLRSLAEDFEKDRNMKTFARLLMVISATTNYAALDTLCQYLGDTADQSINADWEMYLKTHKMDTPSDAPF